MMVKTQKYLTLIVIFTGLFLMSPAISALTFYTDRAAWEADVGSDIVTENFDSITPYFLNSGLNSAGQLDIELINVGEVTELNSIYGIASSLSVDGTPFFRAGLLRSDPDSVIKVMLPNPARAFGADFESTNSSDGLWFEVNGSQHAFGDYLVSGGGSGFLGFTSTNPFSEVAFFDPVKEDLSKFILRSGEAFGMDNVSFEIPEPMTVMMLGFGTVFIKKLKYRQ